MSRDRLHELDQTSAIFSALGSFWWRLVAFFGCCWLGHYVGIASYSAGELFSHLDFFQDGLISIGNAEHLNPLLVPLSWFWMLVSGCSNPLGLIQLFILGAAFLVVWQSEDRFYHGFGVVLLSQPLHSFFVSLQDSGHLNGMDWVFAVIILFTWEVGIGGLYWWFCRQME